MIACHLLSFQNLLNLLEENSAMLQQQEFVSLKLHTVRVASNGHLHSGAVSTSNVA
jgi:hypothetical protein